MRLIFAGLDEKHKGSEIFKKILKFLEENSIEERFSYYFWKSCC